MSERTSIIVKIQEPNVIAFEVHHTHIASMIYNGIYTHFSIHNMPIDSIIEFRDKLNKAIQDELNRQVNEMGSMPNEVQKDVR
jgi:hypothetical protein